MTPEEQMQVINRLCPCCGVDPQSIDLPVGCDNMDLADLGAGYVMYFKMVIFFGIIMILFSIISVIKAISNSTKGYCTTSTSSVSISSNAAIYPLKGWQVCSFDWITAHSVANYGVMNVDSQEKTWVLIFFLFTGSLSLVSSLILRRPTSRSMSTTILLPTGHSL